MFALLDLYRSSLKIRGSLKKHSHTSIDLMDEPENDEPQEAAYCFLHQSLH
jgi:hypothetical protein